MPAVIIAVAKPRLLCYGTPSMEIVLATRNKKKIEEIKRIIADLPIEVLSLDHFPDCPETVEDKDTFEGNAIKKAIEVCKCTGKPALADDSGLEVDALGGAPGVYSARYAGEEGNAVKNCKKLLSNMQSVPDEKRGAQFVCCIALAFPDGSVKTFFGYVKGRIGHAPKGDTGFGYDPVFMPKNYKKTFAEMSGTEKDRLSHRGNALLKLKNSLRTLLAL
jgi:XTP/dITP diphosphohydrolase